MLTALTLLRSVPSVSPEINNKRIYEMFNSDPTLEVSPVASNGTPIGLITRANLESGAAFCACDVDLDHFKPYNDVYGYRKGDDILRLTD